MKGDTIVDLKRNNAIITLVERLSKVIIILKPQARRAQDIETILEHWFHSIPKRYLSRLPLIAAKNFLNEIEAEIYEYLIQPKVINTREGDGPLLSEIVKPHLIQIGVEANNWEEAIRLSAQPLLEHEYITQNYIEDMIKTTKETGPYIVITKHLALPHARPESGAKEIGISIATLKYPIEFGNENNDPVKYVFCLSAKDNSTHLNAMAELVEILERSDFYQTMDLAKSPTDIYDYIINFEK